VLVGSEVIGLDAAAGLHSFFARVGGSCKALKFTEIVAWMGEVVDGRDTEWPEEWAKVNVVRVKHCRVARSTGRREMGDGRAVRDRMRER
jgi:hypothetical protein